MRCKAHIEFHTHDSVRITTLFKQEIIDLHEMKRRDLRCDLRDLSMTKERPPVYFSVSKGKGTIEEKYVIRIQIIQNKGRRYQSERIMVDGKLRHTVEVNLV